MKVGFTLGDKIIINGSLLTFDFCTSRMGMFTSNVQMLREAKDHCDYLICGLQVDPSVDRAEKNQPIQTVVERYSQLKAVRYVDEIIPYSSEADLNDILAMYHIDVRILGDEYREKDFTGKEICKRRDIALYFNKRDHRFSSSELRNRVASAGE
jgi:glycerol-3-phosphate cytidylyltransferase